MGLLGKMLRGARKLRNREDWTEPCIYAFETHTEVAEVAFTWDEINVVRAHKIDLMTTDEIRVVVSFGSPEKVLELSEEQKGFEVLSALLNENSLEWLLWVVSGHYNRPAIGHKRTYKHLGWELRD